MVDDEVQRQLDRDARRVRKLKSNSFSVNPPQLLEGVMWTGVGASVIGMLVSMPWVGPSKVIPPMLWLSYSLGGIVFFGLFGVLIRVVFSRVGREYDREISRRMEGER